MRQDVNGRCAAKSKVTFFLNTLGWLMVFTALFMGAIGSTAFDPGLYFKYQLEANVLDYAGISEEDLLLLDVHLADYLSGIKSNVDFELKVFGQKQNAFNAREIRHLADCRTLLAPVSAQWFGVLLAIAGVVLIQPGKRGRRAAPWIASAIILLPIAFLGFWAAVDFNSAFNFFHKILFTNDLWLLNPRTDLLIRICPASMFAGMGLRIALKAALVLLGLPLIVTMLRHLSERKRKTNEIDL